MAFIFKEQRDHTKWFRYEPNKQSIRKDNDAPT